MDFTCISGQRAPGETSLAATHANAKAETTAQWARFWRKKAKPEVGTRAHTRTFLALYFDDKPQPQSRKIMLLRWIIRVPGQPLHLKISIAAITRHRPATEPIPKEAPRVSNLNETVH